MTHPNLDKLAQDNVNEIADKAFGDWFKRMVASGSAWTVLNWFKAGFTSGHAAGYKEAVVSWNESCYQTGHDAGYEKARKEVIEYLLKYREAYDETLCPPRKLEEFDPMVRTVVAFHMGRFLIDNMIKDCKESRNEKD